ncbi:histidinol dehydrogenase [Candidatus Peregrinibacteria bacterium]|jgi:histidinol dehydrogenase|nr:histidinol dehydrogenase [Candidatus Peregrinibacteria bacterium]
MKTCFYKQLDATRLQELTQRPQIDLDGTYEIVRPIMEEVKSSGDTALKYFTRKFDSVELESLEVSEEERNAAASKLSDKTKNAFKKAAENIRTFHKSQILDEKVVETMPGVTCFRQSRAIEKVGLYIPAGTAPLPSTVLMLGIPAQIAGCEEIILCTPPPVAPEILYAAELCGITKIFQVGGAQAIAAMTYGTESIPQTYKIFGPGNQYVTAAKMLAQLEGIAIDMPAGPSEVIIIADDNANPEFVAADLLSQAEHGTDSQVVLVCLSERVAEKVNGELQSQLSVLPRKEIAKESLSKSFTLICESLDQAFKFSNQYAPEHLILNVENPDKYIQLIKNTGSVFLGKYSCESAGDYASGTNHTLPTYGYAKAYSGVSLDSFVKKITFQRLTEEGVRNLGPIVEEMAECEQLFAHKNAMSLRLKNI